jgi:MoaA/NifB/PqqE/SkfB family radical SAM enzyme
MIESLLKKLDFNPLACIDLGDITVGQSVVYKILNNLYQPEFNSTDRIFFYTKHQIPELLWKHLYQAANLIDISNFFITVVSPNDISVESIDQSKKWSTDSVPFNTLRVPITDSKLLRNDYIVSDKICPLPWSHLEIRNNGDISPCCISQDTIKNIKNNKLEDVFYGKYMSDLRSSFLTGGMPAACSTCWKNESSGVTSHRQRHLSLLKSKLLLQWLDEPKITSLDLKPGNTCNFKCRICGPESSSLWLQENKSQLKINPSKTTFNWAEESENIFDQIHDQGENLINIDMYGGEPFLIKPLTALAEHLVDRGVSNKIRLHYNSNGSIWPDKLVPLWKHFLHVDLHISIDNVKERFELERGGSWDEVDSNIRRFKNLNFPNLKISIMPVVNIMNVLYIDELFLWASNLGLDVNVTYLHLPGKLSIYNLTADAKNLVLDKFKDSPNSEIQKIMNVIKNSTGSNGKDFVDYMKHLDQIRNEKFFNTHKDIAYAMGYVL